MAALLLLWSRSAGAQSPGASLILPAAEAARIVPAGARELSLDLESVAGLFESQSSREGSPGFRLKLSATLRRALSGALSIFDPPPAPPVSGPRRPDHRTLWVTAGALAVVPVVGALSWWRFERTPFHVDPEGWFGEDTYAGGADKASHFVVSYTGTRLLSGAYRKLGNSPGEANWKAAGVVALSGVLVEVGDGTAHYGFSWSDIGMDVLGAFAGVGIEAAGIQDLVGFRFAYVGAEKPPSAAEDTGPGTDYSREMYTMDFKLSGAMRRLNWRPGVSRFLLFSLTYGSKGYRYSPPELRERNVGLELGLNLPEVLRAARVPETRWWGRALITFFEFVRLPFTGIGYQYDLNHGRWHGPTAGNAYDPGP
ncbi:MAG: DUF2279 domain-containing protein [Thermoanaerobaculia bacterium]